jgi:hypothetical protein
MDENKKPLLIGLVVAALCGGGAVLYFRKPAAPPPAVSVPEPAPAPVPTEPLPPLSESDALARKLALEAFPDAGKLKDWLRVDDILRRLSAAVALISSGESPRESLSFLAPSSKFKAVKKDGRLVVDPATWARYDGVAAAVGALDAAAAGRILARIDPLLQQACSELGAMNCSFKDSLLKSIRHLLAAPQLEGDVPVRAKVLSYAYADERLEKLSKAQKHLLRLGPANQRTVQHKLRELGRALGASDL